MKKIGLLIMLTVIIFTSSGCSKVSNSEHEYALSHNIELETEVELLKSDLRSLKEDYADLENLKVDKGILQLTLANVYDGYREMMVYITTEVYKDSLSKKEWEEFITNGKKTIPTFDEIENLVNN